MDRLHLMTVFAAVAEEQGFSAAARRLSMSAPAVTRAIAALESRLGVKLLNRTTRYVRTTDAGERYLADARRIIADVDEADEAAAGINAAPRGQLAITAPALFGRMFVVPNLVEYLQTYPDVEVSALFVDRVVNLMEEGQDVGIRIGELPDSSMRALKVGSTRKVVCASTEYLEKNGIPTTPEQLAKHNVVSSTGVSPTDEWRFEQNGKAITTRVKPAIRVTTNDATIEAIHHGFGLARVMAYQVAPLLKAGALKIVLADYEPPALPIHILHREGRYPSAKIRSFVDFMAERLRDTAALN